MVDCKGLKKGVGVHKHVLIAVGRQVVVGFLTAGCYANANVLHN